MQVAQARLKEARDEAATREEQFERELATARSLADMQRELATDRAARCAELEGIIRELQKNMEARGWGRDVPHNTLCTSPLVQNGFLPRAQVKPVIVRKPRCSAA